MSESIFRFSPYKDCPEWAIVIDGREMGRIEKTGTTWQWLYRWAGSANPVNVRRWELVTALSAWYGEDSPESWAGEDMDIDPEFLQRVQHLLDDLGGV